jgi:hypothetical protein
VVLGDVQVCEGRVGERTLWRTKVIVGQLLEQPVLDETLLVGVAISEDDGLTHEADRHGAHAVRHRASDGLLGFAVQVRALAFAQPRPRWWPSPTSCTLPSSPSTMSSDTLRRCEGNGTQRRGAT